MRASLPIKEKRLPSILLLYPSALLSLAFCFCSLLLTYFTYQSLRHAQHEDEHRYQTYLLATQLHRRSDQLTLMSRSYAMTGDVKYFKLYNEALAFRVGKQFQQQHHHQVYWDMLMPKSHVKPTVKTEEKSFKQLIENLKLPAEEMTLLLQVKRASMVLSKSESQAFLAIEKGLASGNYNNSAAQQQASALLYSEDYLLEKGNIERSISEFFALQEPRSIEAIASNTTRHYVWASLTTLSFLVLIAFLLYNLFKQSKSKQVFVKALRKEVSNRTLELFEKREQLKVVIHEMEETKNQLVESEKMASLGNLVSGVAHEVNTPLGISVTLGSYLQDETKSLLVKIESGQLKRSDLDKYCVESIESFTLLLSNLDRAANLISSFKQVAVDQSSDEIRTFKASEYIDELLLSLHPVIKKTEITIVVGTSDNEPLINTYPGAIAQIVTNLVMNALIHAFDEGKQGKIDISVAYQGTQVELCFSDNGKGMEADIASRIFEPFFTTQRGNGGSGLGMSIVYNLVVHQLGGTIKCKSVLRKGTSFTIRFPADFKSSSSIAR
ncbi:sensor histidine kinase [Psychromonas sp. Urea-02u-13]|uniref:sensor histidine kinase n=1 Tax=Psychromonas sp. Urea-02u-13 TaxID=2058326 RepID=UPI000C3371D5|nr:HAMP domain-containing sensor histidine kinase [Psychromonas sp. Urea-02u-13]PKG37211.1 hypothetical protein CXF74_20040 [Psychromonas sp. Urea-02u-13]